MRTDTDDRAGVRDPAIELLLSHTLHFDRRTTSERFLCEGLSVPLVWVTGAPRVGKSTVGALLRSRGELAVDSDWEGCNHWVDRTNGQVVADPPYPVPAGWLSHSAWRISRAAVEALVARVRDETAFLFGSVENEVEARTTNAFGQHAE
jgi:hypothetical protein